MLGFIYLQLNLIFEILFAISLVFFTVSLVISLLEIQLSTKAFDIELSNRESWEGSYKTWLY